PPSTLFPYTTLFRSTGQGRRAARRTGGGVVILLLDHRDSFVHTLAGYAAKLGADTHVVRDDAITVAGIQALAPERIVLSPGPCTDRKSTRLNSSHVK